MKKTKMEKGITLIALIIMIVILLILAVVAINSIKNDGILGKAENTTKEYNQSVKNEQSILGEYDKFLDERINGEKRNLNISYTQTEGTDLLESIVTFEITIEETLEQTRNRAVNIFNFSNFNEFKVAVENYYSENDDPVVYEELFDTEEEEIEFLNEVIDLGGIEYLRNIVAYMFDFSNFNEFKSFIEKYYSTDEKKVTYEEVFKTEDEEREFLNEKMELGKKILSFKDIAKLESLGIKVISVETPYGTTRYTTNLGGEVKCGFCKNGTYTFKIKSGGTLVTKDITINNIKNYNEQAPYSIKLALGTNAGDKTAIDMEYAIDNSETFENLEFNNSVNFEANNKVSYEVEGNVGLRDVRYVIKDEEYYKYFTSEEMWSNWYYDEDVQVLAILYKYNSDARTIRQFVLVCAMGGLNLDQIGARDGEWFDCMDEYYIITDLSINIEDAKIKYPQTAVGFRVTKNGNNVISGEIEISKNASIYMEVQTCLTTDTEIEVVIWDDEKKKKIRTKKKLKDLTYEDELVVWDFDKGEFTTAKPLWIMKTKVASRYNLLKFSDGSELKTINQHRIFNKELGKFTYPMTDETPIGTTTYTADGKEVKLVSKEVIVKDVEYSNVITKYHMNVFANNILTSCRFSNVYSIRDMKYVKENRKLVGIEEYKNIPEEYYYGLRLEEQLREVNRGNDDTKHAKTIEEYIQNMCNNAK